MMHGAILAGVMDGLMEADEYPEEWYWYDGKLTNNRDDQEFSYLHFIEWKINEWKNINRKKVNHKDLGKKKWIFNKDGISVI